jgi:hypothetical protein
VSSFIPGYAILCTGMKPFCLAKLYTKLQNYSPSYKTTHSGTKLHTQVKRIHPGKKLLNQLQIYIHILVQNYTPRSKLHTRVQNYKPGYKTTHPGTKLHTQVQNYTPRYKTTHLGTKLFTRCKTFTDERAHIVGVVSRGDDCAGFNQVQLWILEPILRSWIG